VLRSSGGLGWPDADETFSAAQKEATPKPVHHHHHIKREPPSPVIPRPYAARTKSKSAGTSPILGFHPLPSALSSGSGSGVSSRLDTPPDGESDEMDLDESAHNHERHGREIYAKFYEAFGHPMRAGAFAAGSGHPLSHPHAYAHLHTSGKRSTSRSAPHSPPRRHVALGGYHTHEHLVGAAGSTRHFDHHSRSQAPYRSTPHTPWNRSPEVSPSASPPSASLLSSGAASPNHYTSNSGRGVGGGALNASLRSLALERERVREIVSLSPGEDGRANYFSGTISERERPRERERERERVMSSVGFGMTPIEGRIAFPSSATRFTNTTTATSPVEPFFPTSSFGGFRSPTTATHSAFTSAAPSPVLRARDLPHHGTRHGESPPRMAELTLSRPASPPITLAPLRISAESHAVGVVGGGEMHLPGLREIGV